MKRLLSGVGVLMVLLSCGQLPCDCTVPEVRVLVYDAGSGSGVGDVVVTSDPPVSFTCTEFADETECVGTAEDYGPMTVRVSAPGYRATTVQGTVEQPNTELVCDCGGLSLSVPLDSF